MERQIEQVKEFHKAFNIPVINKPQIPSLERCEMRQNILEEEVQELKNATEKKDIVEIADAITDCLYVLLGTAHEFGLANVLSRCFDEVHDSNMSKLDENGKPIYREDGKILKSKQYKKPKLKKIINTCPHARKYYVYGAFGGIYCSNCGKKLE